MKGKYITTDILLACLSKKPELKNIHQQLQETIDEYKLILQKADEKVNAEAKIPHNVQSACGIKYTVQ